MTRDDSQCPKCRETFHFDEQHDEVMNLVVAINNCVGQYQSSLRADPGDYYQSLRDLYTKLTSTVSHPFKLLVFAEQQFHKAMKQVYGNKITTRR